MPDCDVIVYGSRAKGNYTERSDLDLVIKNTDKLDANLLFDLKDEVDDSDFPYLVDLQYYDQIQNPSLREHIDRVGKVLIKLRHPL